MKKEYMQPTVTVISLVVNQNLAYNALSDIPIDGGIFDDEEEEGL